MSASTKQIKEAVAIARKFEKEYNGGGPNNPTVAHMNSRGITVAHGSAWMRVKFAEPIAGLWEQPRPVRLEDAAKVCGEWTAKDTPSANATNEGGWTAAGIEFPPAAASETSTPTPEARTKQAATYATADLHDLAAKVASRDDMRPVLCGVRFEPNAVVATDSFRLGVITAEGPAVGITAPAAAVRIITEKAGEWTALSTGTETSGADPDSPGTVIGLETVTKTGNSVTLEVSAVDGQFPDYARLFPEQHECSARMDTDAALAASKKVKRWADENRPAVVEWTADAVTLEFPNANGPSVKPQPITSGTAPQMPVALEPTRIGVNPEFLHDGLEFVGEDATLEAVGPLRPMNLSSGNRRYLVMPVRIGA
jgi:hypothetical protein